MKILKVILLLFLICKSSLLVGFNIDLGQKGSCCASETELSCEIPMENGEDEQKGNCCGSNCDCLCCGHIFTLNKELTLDFSQLAIIGRKHFSIEQIWSPITAGAIWQPPRLC